ncbi:hypothetical protein I4U23_021374 [Adineta vaga]|nr:hypothetical protein I4U23_021374 [Adineta vaga]
MKFIAVCIALLAAIYVVSSRVLSETDLLQRLNKRQAYNDPNCNPRACAVPNCGNDFVAVTLLGKCCEHCVPWEYAHNARLQLNQPQSVQDYRGSQFQHDPYNQQNRVDIYIYAVGAGSMALPSAYIHKDLDINLDEIMELYTQMSSRRLDFGL